MRRIILAIIIFISASVLVSYAESSSVPSLINYQGMLADADGNPLTGTKKLEFSLYDAPTGGNRVWGPQIFSSVPLMNGRFNVILSVADDGISSIADAFSSSNRYLGIKVDNGQELSPRQQILSAPYAIQADVAKTVRGPDLYVDPNNGNVGIGTTSPEEKLTVDGTVHSKTGGFKFPDGTVKTTAGLPPADYDSGWFEVETSHYYSKEHNLGTLPRLAVIWAASDEYGKNMTLMDGLVTAGIPVGCWLKKITTNSYEIQVAIGGYLASLGDYGEWPPSPSGYIRVLMWK